jgi:uncharacterized membrane protein
MCRLTHWIWYTATISDHHANAGRYIELDVLRGLAVFLMIVYHAAFDLHVFYQVPLPVFTLAGKTYAWFTAGLFLLLAGISFTISWERTPARHRLAKAVRRTGLIGLAAALVSAVSWWFAPAVFVRFGILHLIAVAALLTPFCVRLRQWNALLGSALVCAGGWLATKPLPITWYWLGGHFGSVPTIDYYPLLPWLGVLICGMGIGYYLYIPSFRFDRERLGDTNLCGVGSIAWLGRHALLVYLLHQPILIALWFLLLGTPLFRW